jgi:hypothetical protein
MRSVFLGTSDRLAQGGNPQGRVMVGGEVARRGTHSAQEQVVMRERMDRTGSAPAGGIPGFLSRVKVELPLTAPKRFDRVT